MVAARSKAVPSGDWVYNIGGWSVDQFADSRAKFTREELDRIAPNNPVASRSRTTAPI
jgi:predicted amidohydrolase YtcJ